MDMARLQKTEDDRPTASIRLVLAVLFVMTGTMKLVVPMLAEAWSGQLLASGLPFYELSRWSVPFLEIIVGVALGVGLFVRSRHVCRFASQTMGSRSSCAIWRQ